MLGKKVRKPKNKKEVALLDILIGLTPFHLLKITENEQTSFG